MGPSPWQLLVILLVVILLFGTKKLRGMGGDLGAAIKGFRNSVKDDSDTESTEAIAEQDAENSTAAKTEHTEKS